MNSRESKPRRANRGLWRRFLLYVFLALFLSAVVAGLWPKPIQVETASVTRGPLTVSVLEEGKTRIRHRYVISPPVGGYLHRVELRAGAPIRAGQTVLATIQAEASGFLDPRTRAEAEARVQSTEATGMQRRSEVGRAKAALELSKKDFARLDALFHQGAIARQEWDAADNKVAILTRDLNSAEFALRAAEFEVVQARARLQQATSSEADGSGSIRIIAPIDGYVLNVYEENARVIAAGAPIMEIGDPRDLETEIELLSSDAVAVEPGAEVSIEQWGDETPLRGRVSLVERGGFTKVSALGVEEQRVKVRVDILDSPPPGRELGDRFRVEGRIVIWRGDDVLQVPTGALFRRGNDWMTFVVEDNRARLRKVGIDRNNGIAAEVLSGLSQGEAVIVYPPDKLTDGDSVAARSEGSIQLTAE
ncbi:MAG: HlyD family efflux transporter periplasmic adaptor subunit [Deltaproteobacteria bacterium]|nr:HlyD family efflux transporter periplasmic adaptor subunit [Deltaproteobacteria bacterium]